MSFWEDASPVVKIALVVGVVGIIVLGVLWGMGLPPFVPSCTHADPAWVEVEGEDPPPLDDCQAGAECIEGVCVVNNRGL